MKRLDKYRYGLILILGVVSWIPIVILNAFFHLVGGLPDISIGVPPWVVSVVYALFILFNMLAIQQAVSRIKNWNVVDLLWKILVIGVAGIAIIFLFKVFDQLYAERQVYRWVEPIQKSVSTYAALLFLGSTYYLFRKLIYYQKTRKKVVQWMIFEGLMVIALLLLFDHHVTVNVIDFNKPENFIGYVKVVLLPLFFVFSLLLSSNVNWAVYLNINQKLKAMLMLVVILMLLVTYSLNFPALNPLVESKLFLIHLFDSNFIFFAFLFYFPLIYVIFSLLVIIFNLPTSSVFEQQSSEIASLTKLLQSIQANHDQEHVFQVLLNAGMLSSNSLAGWIKPLKQNRSEPIYQNIEREHAESIELTTDIPAWVQENKASFVINNFKKDKALRTFKSRFKSLAAFPIMSQGKQFGILFLVNNITNSFEKESLKSLQVLVEQAGFTIDNIVLTNKSIAFERYREQLKISREVQEQILPKSLPKNDKIEFYSLSQDAEEIGGDYYDVRQNGNEYKVAIGDVSGKGTRAAFYMAETKGMFQALTGLDLAPNDFLSHANNALSVCFEPGHFFTMIYLTIDVDQRVLKTARAGHCPAVYYDSQKEEISFLENGSPGLAIIRSGNYDRFLGQEDEIHFHPDDIIFLYTDGIAEARSHENEEFGYDRLKQLVFKYRNESSQIIAENILKEVKSFTTDIIEDDYTIMAIKFS